MIYKFFGWEKADVLPTNKKYKKAGDPRHLYDILTKCWCRETCAPRMQKDWSEDNFTLGQCSITAFLLQDIYGGDVLGIRLPDGSYHCYNKIDECVFDITSEQFGDTVLDYSDCCEQKREDHFAKQEKYERYLLLKKELENALNAD